MKDLFIGLEPAFPCTHKHLNSHGIWDTDSYSGVSKRFYAACAAMQGMLSNHLMIDQMSNEAFEYLVQRSYKCADELLKQENEKNN